ncbi:MAG: MBL fold metallo-hydrolase [Verrucomicrobiales bacterium]
MPFVEIKPDIFQWTDTCHVYVLRDRDAGLLIDLGDGSVLDHLSEIGIRRIDWLLFTHHHREQCQGGAKLAPWRNRGMKVATSETERGFFENPGAWRKWRPTLSDPHSVYGASYARPPLDPVKIDQVFKKMDVMGWRGREIWCVETPGNSPGHMAYAATLSIDRLFRDGESFEWEGYHFTVDWMPGQTKYHACLHGEIDGRRVAFCGDNIFASTTDPKQGGNECVLARNGGTLEEGYLYAAAYLHSLNPDLIIGGHCWVLDQPAALIERFRKRMIALRDAFQDLSTEADYRVMFDPFWVRAEPYRTAIDPGQEGKVLLRVKNWLDRERNFRLVPHSPKGVTVSPSIWEEVVAPGGSAVVELVVRADANCEPGLKMIALDTTVDKTRLGEWFDFLVMVV